MEMIELTFPWPPSVNKYWRTFQGRMIISAEGRSYRKAVADQVLIQRSESIDTTSNRENRSVEKFSIQDFVL